MEINNQPVRQFLGFWKPIPDPHREPPDRRRPEFTAAWLADRKAEIGSLDDSSLLFLTDEWRDKCDGLEAVRERTQQRAGGLLLMIGIITGLGTLVKDTVVGAPLMVVVVWVLVALTLGYCAVASAFLAVRTLQVATFDSVHLHPRVGRSARGMRVEAAHEYYCAYRRNRIVVDNLVGYLRDAQTYALAVIVLVAVLTGCSAVAALARPPVGGPSQIGSVIDTPVIGPSHSPTPSGAGGRPATSVMCLAPESLAANDPSAPKALAKAGPSATGGCFR